MNVSGAGYRERAGSRAGSIELPSVEESRPLRSTFEVEQGDAAKAERDPKEGAALGWAKIRAVVKSAKSEAQGLVRIHASMHDAASSLLSFMVGQSLTGCSSCERSVPRLAKKIEPDTKGGAALGYAQMRGCENERRVRGTGPGERALGSPLCLGGASVHPSFSGITKLCAPPLHTVTCS